MKSQTDFIFNIDVDLDLPKLLQCLVDKTLCCLENIYLKSSRPELFYEKYLKDFSKSGNSLCRSLLFNKDAG